MGRIAALFVISLAYGEIIDRIAVAVDRRVITESEIIRQIRITAFLNNVPPDESPSNKRATADRLVEQVLIRRELETSRYASPESAPPVAYQEMKTRFRADEEYKQTLSRYRITDADVREALEWQATLLEFIDLRFRPGVQVPESEVRDYYQQQSVQNPGKLPSFEEARNDIESILISQRVDNAVDRWLGQARTQTTIRYTQEVFR
jgi:hypothetical protein